MSGGGGTTAEGSPVAPPGWYPGPDGRLRWWDGWRWGPVAPAPPPSTGLATLAHPGFAMGGFGVTVADGYGAYQTAAVGSAGNSCTAGLLTQLTPSGCGVHPTAAGQSVLALAVEEATQQR